jgi:peptidyl-prolyl cis-trans isomerase SurA
MLQRASDLGYRVDDDQVDRVIESIKTENSITSKQEFDELLQREGIGRPMLRASLARQILIQQVRQSDVFGKIRVSEDEARAYHAARRDEFAIPAAVTFREIVVGVPPGRTEREARMTQAQRDAALIRFVRAGDRVRNGADFASVARDFSEAPSAAAGGLVGPVSPSELPETAWRALSRLQAGDVSESVSIEGAYALLKLETWTEGDPQPFDKSRDAVIARLTEERQRAELEKYLRRLRTRAIIEWKSAELKSAYERHLAQP